MRETESYRTESVLLSIQDQDEKDVEDIKWRRGRSDNFVMTVRNLGLLKHAYRSEHSDVMRNQLRFEMLRIREHGVSVEKAVFAEYDEEARDSLSAKGFERVMVDLRLPYDLDQIREMFGKLRDTRTNRVTRDTFVKWLSDSQTRVETCESTLSRFRMRYANAKLGMRMVRQRWSGRAARMLAKHELASRSAKRSVHVALEMYGSVVMTEQEMLSRASDVFANLTKGYLESLNHDELSSTSSLKKVKRIETMQNIQRLADSEFMKLDTNARGYLDSKTCADAVKKIASARYGLNLERTDTIFQNESHISRKQFVEIFKSESDLRRLFEKCAAIETKKRSNIMRWCSYVLCFRCFVSV